MLARAHLRHIALMAGLAWVILTVTGPFGTYERNDALERGLYWAIALIGCGAIFHVACDQMLFTGRMPHLSRVSRMILAVLIAALPASVLVYGLEMTLGGGLQNQHIPWLYLCVATVGMMISAVNFLPPFAPAIHHEVAFEPQPGEAFLARLPKELGTAIDSLSMRDHYVEVFTALGSAMLHMRFSDAMEELTDFPGGRTHRSHWVADQAVEAVRRDGRKLQITTKAGRELPVSGSYRDHWEGWLL